MRARLVGCLFLAVIGVWAFTVLAVLLAIAFGGLAAVGGAQAWIAGIGTPLVLLFLAALVPWVPHYRSGEIEIPLPPEETFDALVNFQRNATISGLRRAEVIYVLSGDDLIRDRNRLVVGGAATWIWKIKADRPNLLVTRLRAGGQDVTITRRLSPAGSGTRVEVEESGRLGLLISILSRRVPESRLERRLLESILDTAAAEAER